MQVSLDGTKGMKYPLVSSGQFPSTPRQKGLRRIIDVVISASVETFNSLHDTSLFDKWDAKKSSRREF